MTKHVAEYPLVEERAQRRERHGQQTHEDVAERQVTDEYVGDVLYGLVAYHNVDHLRVYRMSHVIMTHRQR